MTPVPLLLLDVDGVLNALGGPNARRSAWRQWRFGYATAGGIRWPITFAPEVIDRLRAWHDSGDVEIQWLSTWGDDANGELRRLLGLPPLPVAGTYEEHGAAGWRSSHRVAAHADVAPAAPDPLSGRWWKYDVVRRTVERYPDRRVVWADDELTPWSAFTAWVDTRPNLTAIGPDPETGLSRRDLDRIAERLRRAST